MMRIGSPVLLSVVLLQFLNPTGVAKADSSLQVSTITCTRVSGRIALRSTYRLPEASGAARVERKGGTTEIDVELDSMKPAWLFGGDYNTYVLWVVPPGGPAENVGEITLEGSQAALRASTSAAEFGVLVTAEPHFLVRSPSAFVVLENEANPNGRIVGQQLIEGVYNFSRSTLDDAIEAKGPVHSDVKQAFTAVHLARRAGAATLAGPEFVRAQRALEETFALWKARKPRPEIAARARQTVELAVAARRVAEESALQRTRGKEGTGGGNGETEGRTPQFIDSDRR
jgi:hypothetical protein